MLPQHNTMLTPLLRYCVLVCVALFLNPFTFVHRSAQAEVSIPELSSPVIDSGEFLSRSEEERLRERLTTLKQSGGPQMQIWTLKSLEGEPIETLSLRAVEKWKLGNIERDDGLLLTIAKSERRYRLEVGQGLEGVIPDIMASRLLRKYLVPGLRTGTTDSALLALIDEIERLVRPGQSSADDVQDKHNPLNLTLLYIFLILLFIGGLLFQSIVRRGGRGRSAWETGGVNDSYHGSYGSGSRGGWGGGWGGGGGGFSGGGASGDW
ncbi:MAG: TPM domain-containing protein [Betaproteobacteria bacterium]|nr:TPM domain-containing protein [Betaproteobacteria bacterium]